MPLHANSNYWVPHPEHAFLPCMYMAAEGENAVFMPLANDGEEMWGMQGQVIAGTAVPKEKISIKASEAEALVTVSQAQLEGVDNICSLEEVTKASVLHTVRTRYVKSDPLVYTRVARIMIAVNPFKPLPIYGTEQMKRYLQVADPMDLPPHVFAIGADAVLGLKQEDAKNQAVLISGESGAGKTESTKLILSYVSEALVSASGGIQDKIMQTNPVLEAFGNAMTVRNNNSSRFGKWLQMTMSNSCSIKSCSIVDYLLELTRVVKQGQKERNYHVFFQLISAREELKEHLKILEPSGYRYIKDSQSKAPNVDDRACFDELVDALDTLGFEPAVRLEIFKIVIGILTLGNIEFLPDGDGEGCKVQGDQAIGDCAGLLGVQADALRKMVVVRLIKVAGDVTEALRSPAQAEQARDGLARLLYGRLFKFLIAKINSRLSEDGSEDGRYLGVLDIAGFESFEHNSIEQLFINLSNEHLQSHFNNHIFKMELDDYKAEGIEAAASLTYQDNADIIALLDSKASILGVLDEEVSVPRASDQTFIAKVFKTFEKHARIVIPKIGGGASFGVRHFAGEVSYNVQGFLEKNVDKPPDEAPDVFKDSDHGVLKEIGGIIAAEIAESQAPGKKQVKTVSSMFRKSLAALMEKLNQAEPHFIRCIKPNQEKVPCKFTAPLVMDQLNYSGVFEAVRIRQSGFPTRVPFKEFISRYRPVAPKAVQRKLRASTASEAENVNALLEAIRDIIFGPDVQANGKAEKSAEEDIIVGKTKVFCRTRAMIALDRARDLSLSIYVVDIQRIFRGYLARKMVRSCKAVFKELAEWRSRNQYYTARGPEHTAVEKLKTADAIASEVETLNAILKKTENLPLPVPRGKEVEALRHRMEQEVEVIRTLQSLTACVEVLEIDKAVARAKDLDITQLPEMKQLQARSVSLKSQIPLIKGMENAINEKDLDDMQDVLDCLKEHGLFQHPENWLKELKGEETARSFVKTMEQLQAEKKKEEEEENRRRQEEDQKRMQEERQKDKLEEPSATTSKHIAFEEQEVKPTVSEKEQKRKAREERRSRKSTITGLTMDEQNKILLNLMGAMETYDMQKLEVWLKKAVEEGIQEQETLSEAEVLLADMEREEYLIAQMVEQEELLNAKTDETRVLKSMQNLIKQATALQVASADVARVRQRMQEKVRLRARKTVQGRLFEGNDPDLADLVDEAFSNLSEFPGLKSPATWKGHKSASFFSRGDSGPGVMLSHHKMDLRQALTTLDPSLESQACSVFHNILGWMCDRPLPETSRTMLMQEVVSSARKDVSMTNETYVQVMKQLTANPSPRSVLQGWKLVWKLLQEVPPGPELRPFVHVFLKKAQSNSSKSPEIQSYINLCIAESTIATDSENNVKEKETWLQVHLIDGSSRKIAIKESTNLRQLREKVAKPIGISEVSDFAFFTFTPSRPGAHRYLPDETLLSALTPRFHKLKQETGVDTQFLFKRKFLRKDEHLKPSCPMHATLTYRQALYDYKKYPVCDGVLLLYEVAVRILWLEREHFKAELESKKLDPILEQFFPEVAVAKQPRGQMSGELLKVYERISAHMDPKEDRLITMQRIFQLMQRMRLFGACHWTGRQIPRVPPDQVSITDEKYNAVRNYWAKTFLNGMNPPALACKIDGKTLDGGYIIVVSIHGVCFVSDKSQPDGAPDYHEYNFSGDSKQRVLVWGARGSTVQLIVTGSFNTFQAMPYTLACSTPANKDIAYLIQDMYNLKLWKKV